MEHRPIGAGGIEVSVVGLGCNNFGRRVDLEGARERGGGVAPVRDELAELTRL